jgi:hypothetical protein
VEGVATERESTLTEIHPCHRPRIPFGHVLIELLCVTKHCRVQQNKERPTHHKQQKRYRFKKHKNKITTRVRIVIR